MTTVTKRTPEEAITYLGNPKTPVVIFNCRILMERTLVPAAVITDDESGVERLDLNLWHGVTDWNTNQQFPLRRHEAYEAAKAAVILIQQQLQTYERDQLGDKEYIYEVIQPQIQVKQ